MRAGGCSGGGGWKRSGAPVFLLACVLSACEGPPPLDSDLRLCDDTSLQSLVQFHLSQEWVVGGAADTVLPLSPPLVYPVPAPGGGLSFAQRPEAPIITLNADGSVRSRMGSAGAGPGGWPPQSTGAVSWYGDTLWVVQMQPPRLHAFSEDGELLESQDLSAALPEPLTLLYRLRNGAVVGTALGQAQERARRLVHWAGPSHPLDSIGVAQEGIGYRVDLPGTAFAFALRPIPDDLLTALAIDGRSVVLVSRKASTGGGPSEFSIRRVAENGETLAERRVCYHPLTIPREARADTITAQAEMLTRGPDDFPLALAEENVRQALELPEFWPPVDRLVVDEAGGIWLRRETRHDHAPWEIRDDRGELTGVMVLPADEVVLAVAGDVVWTQRFDEWDVPLIVRNRLVRE